MSAALTLLLNTLDDGEYKAALDQLSPQIYSEAEISALYASLAFSGSLLSCKVNGADTASIIREGQCLWAGANARFLDSGTTSDQIGFNERPGCSRLARRLRSTISGASVSPAAISRARSTRRPTRKARAR